MKLFVDTKTELARLERRYGKGTWRSKTLRFVHSKWVEITLALLLMVDVFALVAEMLLDAQYPSCGRVKELCIPEPQSCAVTCEERSHALEAAHAGLFGLSIAILAVFLVELLVLFVALGPLFFLNLWYLGDLLLVGTALALEIVYHKTNPSEADAAGYLVLVRIWRFVRLGHAISRDVHELDDLREKRPLEKEIKRLKAELKRLHQQHQIIRSGSFSGEDSTIEKVKLEEETDDWVKNSQTFDRETSLQ